MENENNGNKNYIISKEIDEYAEKEIENTDDFINKFTFPKTPKGKELELDFLDDIADNGMALYEDEQQILITKYKKYYRG